MLGRYLTILLLLLNICFSLSLRFLFDLICKIIKLKDFDPFHLFQPKLVHLWQKHALEKRSTEHFYPDLSKSVLTNINILRKEKKYVQIKLPLLYFYVDPRGRIAASFVNSSSSSSFALMPQDKLTIYAMKRK